MYLAIEIVVSLLFIVFGYVEACIILNDKKHKEISKDILMPNRNRIIYLVACTVSFSAILLIFNIKYRLEPIPIIKCICLLGVIFPCAAVDFKVQKIPNRLILTGIIIRVVIYAVELINNIKEALSVGVDCLLGAFVISLFFFLLMLVFKNSIGMGDIKLFFVMGLFEGLWAAVSSVFFSLVVTFFVSIFLLITKKKDKKDSISFGPNILVGTTISMILTGM